MRRPESIAIVGLGLIGGSLAKRLLVRGIQVVSWDVDPQTRAKAGAAGIDCVSEIEQVCAGEPDLLILAVPLHQMAGIAGALLPNLPARTIVSDVGSVKAPIAALMAELGLASRYVGTHPMAGSEQSGFDWASADLLLGAPWVLTLVPETPRTGVELMMSMVTGDLEGRVHPLSNDVHDASVALVSHLPHAVANELLTVVGTSEFAAVAIGLAAGSFRDGTRVAGTNPRRTEAMLLDNKEWLEAAVRQAIAGLTRFADALAVGEDVAAFFDDPAAIKSRIQTHSRQSGWIDFAVLDDGHWQSELLALGARGGLITAVEPVTDRLQVSW
jgi:prephenate dehydrogenase